MSGSVALVPYREKRVVVEPQRLSFFRTLPPNLQFCMRLSTETGLPLPQCVMIPGPHLNSVLAILQQRHVPPEKWIDAVVHAPSPIIDRLFKEEVRRRFLEENPELAIQLDVAAWRCLKKALPPKVEAVIRTYWQNCQKLGSDLHFHHEAIFMQLFQQIADHYTFGIQRQLDKALREEISPDNHPKIILLHMQTLCPIPEEFEKCVREVEAMPHEEQSWIRAYWSLQFSLHAPRFIKIQCLEALERWKAQYNAVRHREEKRWIDQILHQTTISASAVTTSTLELSERGADIEKLNTRIQEHRNKLRDLDSTLQPENFFPLADERYGSLNMVPFPALTAYEKVITPVQLPPHLSFRHTYDALKHDLEAKIKLLQNNH